jgi:hypothetical protein
VLTYYITYILPRCVSRLPVAAAAGGLGRMLGKVGNVSFRGLEK